MSTNTAMFFAPERPLQDHARKQRYAWRTALASLLIHTGAIITVVVVSQYGIEKKKAAITELSPAPTIQAVLFQPPAKKTVEPSNLLNKDAVDKEVVDREVVDKRTSEVVNEDASEEESADSEIQTSSTADIPDKPNAEPKQPSETKLLPDAHPPQLKEALSKEASFEEPSPQVSKPLINREAGRLNVSSAQAAADYLDSYNEARIGEESANAASSYAAKKRSPNIIDPRKGEDRDEKLYSQRPVKIVNCTSTTNKLFTALSTMAGGTLRCSKRNEHKRFIDARINKTPENDEQTN
ncbi:MULTISPECIES: hypothetical protein [unclassified Alteromonas]|uniref:hypothetical protein n=1 Tax=unclassified Alteromonas TaxID=2614992 RepID=UPI001269103C|nr:MULTISPECIES: hypothetical protein [unclassified Alteromonas]